VCVCVWVGGRVWGRVWVCVGSLERARRLLGVTEYSVRTELAGIGAVYVGILTGTHGGPTAELA
jgi:hypothetical protein